ncbi:MAG: glycerol-3-phosphate 1-O-acyltransferase [Alphaproteobacteria bacterium]|nr:glycerol-3-phosphate 1-O-acyltransferase [Alphaproteobacteria bacterium]NDC57014.1 glycerol-3-phosphate 1-O-acyltransferase [Alphaproteobacteria bacterium]NDG04960.1 glycerol-3-phosphate 1-O-acyltransferase [Alphaproteobacteria bacterium]
MLPDFSTINDSTLVLYLFLAALGYVLGSIPFGYVLVKMSGGGDIRHVGSGNIGATNVLRTGKRSLAIATLVLDISKGVAAVLIAQHFEPWLGALAGFTALLGHLYPVWLQFKGGKGVATTAGILLAIDWRLGLATCVCWLLVALLFRYSSLAALTAIILSPVFAWIFDVSEYIPFCLLMALLVWLRHRTNIMRLVQGIEPKINLKKKKEKEKEAEQSTDTETTEAEHAKPPGSDPAL